MARLHLVNGKAQQAYTLIFDEFKSNHQSVEKSHPILQQAYFMLCILAIEIKKMDKAKEFLMGAYWNSIKKSKGAQDKSSPEKSVTSQDEITAKENQSLWHKANGRFHEEQV